MSQSRKRSSVWMHFIDKGFEKAECNICKSKISIKAGSTFNLRRHLRARHPAVQEAEPRQCFPDADQDKDGANVSATTSFAFVDVTLEDGDSGTITTMNESAYSLKPAEQITHTVASDAPPLKRTQLRRSLVWRHFERLDSLNAAQCSICMKKVQCFKYGGTSNLRRHMSKRHPKVFSELEANGKHGTPLNSTQQDSNATNGTQGTFRAAEQRSFQARDEERRVFRRERELIDALRRTQKEEGLTLEHQRELLEKLRAANAREAAAEREQIESLRKAQQEEAKDLDRQREELQKERAELQKKWEELQQEKEELLLFSRGQ